MSGAVHLTNRLDRSDIKHIFQLHYAGVTSTEIARRYRVSDSSINRILLCEWTQLQIDAWGYPADYTASEVNAVAEPVQQSVTGTKMGILDTVRHFDAMKVTLHDGLDRMKQLSNLTPEMHNAMIDELLDEIAEWRL